MCANTYDICKSQIKKENMFKVFILLHLKTLSKAPDILLFFTFSFSKFDV